MIMCFILKSLNKFSMKLLQSSAAKTSVFSILYLDAAEVKNEII